MLRLIHLSIYNPQLRCVLPLVFSRSLDVNMAQAHGGYFTRFEGFEHDETAALLQEFNRLAITQDWSTHSQRYRKERDKCIAEEFQRHYGRDDNNLNQWQELCREVGLDPPTSIKKCKKV